MHVVGYLASLLIGVSLGLIGGGGSILTVPILVYLFGVDPVTATAYSLFVVGITSLAGSFVHFREGNIEIKTVFLFGIPSVFTVFLLRKFVVPSIPESIILWQGTALTKSDFFMFLFAGLMALSSVLMLVPRNESKHSSPQSNGWIVFQGVVVGIVTGVLGAGGGFLIIPALVLWAKMSMKHAVGTSLAIITINSLIGFAGDVSAGMHFDFSFIIVFSLIATGGIVLGSRLTQFIPNKKLKPAFAVFVLLISFYIFGKELLY
jgi:uncharacterized protein